MFTHRQHVAPRAHGTWTHALQRRAGACRRASMPAAASDADDDNGDGEKDVHKVRRRCASLLLVVPSQSLTARNNTGLVPWCALTIQAVLPG